DERIGAELSGDGIPDFRPPEIQTELCNRQPRLAEQLDANRRHKHNEDEAKEPRPQSKREVVRSLHDTLILSSTGISSLTTSAGRGAYPRPGANFWPSVSAHFRKSTVAFAFTLSLGFSYIRIHVNE